ncbi:MAG: hypothetical protein AAF939_19245 [Planctomycetota bacterium]
MLFRVILLAVASLFSTQIFGQEILGPEGSKLYVRVTQNRELEGIPIDLAEIKVSTSFGMIAVPLIKIDGIKMHADANDSSVIAFKNGDVVTGKVQLEKIKLKTEWGVAHINTEQVEQLTASKGARFFSDSAGGVQGWKFNRNAVSAGSSTTRANFLGR